MKTKRATDFCNALSGNPTQAIALLVVIQNRRTGDERCVDLLVDDDRLATVLKAIRKHFGPEWGLFESMEILDGKTTNKTAA